VNPEPAEQDSFTGDERYETLLEMFCASANDVPDLAGGEMISQAADDLIDGISYEPAMADFHRAFVRAVSTATLPPTALAAAENHSEVALLLFLGQLLAEMERRRPWPAPALVQADPEEWPSLGSSLPIAWMELPLPLVQEAVKASFTAESDADMPLLVLRLRTGQLVALVGEQNPEPSRFLVLLPDAEGQQDSAAVIDYLVQYTGLPLETEGIELSMTTLPDL
jgi:hypothetical protein